MGGGATLAEVDRQIPDAQQVSRSLLMQNVFRGSKASRTASPMNISSDSMMATTTKPVQSQPRRLQVGLALRQQLAQRGRAGRQAEAEEVERGQRGDRSLTG